ncbi:calcitonin gene-related peptide type 1 receptor-like [Sinocyclocheilus anshuiensis]|uniref:calcitonin gene-related peptide type 1 receptor-like n=1 Tax=Sinocyclocheilus anshuiensis TaxID=1608454 RepID=UPI0007BAD8C5|nr:PREDICTED: calcitonin gene-related peptide type 1 receptor-like [Sinocyclocheilus anshuiensis]
MTANPSVLLLLLTTLLDTPLCRGEDVLVMSAEQESHIPESSADLSVARKQILSAQFECYLKIMYDPPRRDPGEMHTHTHTHSHTHTRIGQTIFPNEMCDVSHCVPSEKVTKVCDSDGQWFHHPESNRLWSNYTQCSAYTKQKLELMLVNYYLVMVGQGLSIISLFISICIFSHFKCLSCQRITLHKNMFTSFILNSFATMAWFYFIFGDQRQDTRMDSSQIGCKLLASIMQYTSCSNYFWMLCEGIYLHTLIIVAVFVGEQQLGWYYVLGWGFPVIPAVLYAVARLLFHDDKCWIMNINLLYITHSPIQVALLVSFCFLCEYLLKLITKLRVTHCIETNVYMKAVRATIILVPLLGAQFILVPLEPSGRVSRAVYEFFMNIFAHFQGLLVAVIFCFCNGEVQSALQRKFAQYRGQWMCRRLVTTDSHCNYHTNSSITETSRVTIGLEHGPANTSGTAHVLNGQSNGSVCSKSCDVLESTEI